MTKSGPAKSHRPTASLSGISWHVVQQDLWKGRGGYLGKAPILTYIGHIHGGSWWYTCLEYSIKGSHIVLFESSCLALYGRAFDVDHIAVKAFYSYDQQFAWILNQMAFQKERKHKKHAHSKKGETSHRKKKEQGWQCFLFFPLKSHVRTCLLECALCFWLFTSYIY